jgi:ribonuclease P protein component
MVKFLSLKNNNDFRKILREKKKECNYFTVFFSKRFSKKQKGVLNISFISKKKIGNAVKRNKIKRKIRSVVMKLIKESKKINLDYTYVVFGKSAAYNENFNLIYESALKTFGQILKEQK